MAELLDYLNLLGTPTRSLAKLREDIDPETGAFSSAALDTITGERIGGPIKGDPDFISESQPLPAIVRPVMPKRETGIRSFDDVGDRDDNIRPGKPPPTRDPLDDILRRMEVLQSGMGAIRKKIGPDIPSPTRKPPKPAIEQASGPPANLPSTDVSEEFFNAIYGRPFPPLSRSDLSGVTPEGSPAISPVSVTERAAFNRTKDDQSKLEYLANIFGVVVDDVVDAFSGKVTEAVNLADTFLMRPGLEQSARIAGRNKEMKEWIEKYSGNIGTEAYDWFEGGGPQDLLSRGIDKGGELLDYLKKMFSLESDTLR